MRHLHEATQYLELIGPNDSMEIEVEVTFSFIRGCAAHYGSLSYAGHPAEPDSVEIEKLEAFPLVRDDKQAGWTRGPKIEMAGWLEAFIERAIDESELLSSVSEEA